MGFLDRQRRRSLALGTIGLAAWLASASAIAAERMVLTEMITWDS